MPIRTDTCADGQTALYTACLHMLSQECDVEIVRTLIARGAEVTLPAAIVLEDLDLVRTLATRDPAALAGTGPRHASRLRHPRVAAAGPGLPDRCRGQAQRGELGTHRTDRAG